MTIKSSTKQALAMVATALITGCATCMATRNKTEASSPNTATSTATANPTATSSPVATVTASPQITVSPSLSVTVPPPAAARPGPSSVEKSDGISVGVNKGQINGTGAHDNTMNVNVKPPARHLTDADKQNLRKLSKRYDEIDVWGVADVEAQAFADEIAGFITNDNIKGHRLLMLDGFPTVTKPIEMYRFGKTNDLVIEVGAQ